MHVKVVLAILLAAAVAALVVMATRDDPKPEPGVIEYRNDVTTISETRLMRAERIGRTIWGNVCHGDIAVSVAPLHLYVGQATYWTTDSSAEPDPATFYDCTIIVSDRRVLPWPTLCQVVVHEMGHLAGREHVANPRAVMNFKATKHNVPPRCKRTS